MRLLLFFALTSIITVGAAPAPLYFMQVERNSEAQFLNRFTDGEFHYLVTPTVPNDGVIKSVKLPSASDELHLVEGVDKTAAPLPGEVASLGRIRLVEIPKHQDPHGFLGTHAYHAEPVGNRLFRDSPAKVVQFSAPHASQKSELMIDREYMNLRLRELAGEVPVELDGEMVTLQERRSPAGREVARAWLTKELTKLGFGVEEHGYGELLFAGANLIGKRDVEGINDFVIISAHYDSVGNQGVDDDGTGIVSALTALQAITSHSSRFDIYFLAFDQEELGLIGSKAYADSLVANGSMDQLIGVVNLEMTGYDGDDDGALHVIHCDENSSADLAAHFDFAVTGDDLDLRKVEACTNRSDHASFWRHNKPAIVISQNFFGGDGNPCYHRTCDRMDQVHVGYMERVTTAVARGLVSLVSDE